MKGRLPFFALAVATAGCAAKESAPHLAADEVKLIKPAPTTTHSSRRPLAVKIQPTLVKQGRTPLVYVAERGVVVSVVDATSGMRLAQAPARARTIIRVESRNGVYFNSERLYPGPLPPQHLYTIYLEADEQNVIEQNSEQPQESNPRRLR